MQTQLILVTFPYFFFFSCLNAVTDIQRQCLYGLYQRRSDVRLWRILRQYCSSTTDSVGQEDTHWTTAKTTHGNAKAIFMNNLYTGVMFVYIFTCVFVRSHMSCIIFCSLEATAEHSHHHRRGNPRGTWRPSIETHREVNEWSLSITHTNTDTLTLTLIHTQKIECTSTKVQFQIHN